MEFMQTTHLIIRHMQPSDWSDLYKYLSSEETQQYQNHGVYTKDQCIEEIDRLSQYGYCWSVCLSSNKRVVGFIILSPEGHPINRMYKLHFNFDPIYMVNGFVEEANVRMLQYAFEQLQAHRVMSIVCAQDVQSNKELIKIKMRKEGMLQKAYTYRTTKTNKPIWWDINMYAILKDEWLSSVR